jgi:outer membrane protein
MRRRPVSFVIFAAAASLAVTAAAASLAASPTTAAGGRSSSLAGSPAAARPLLTLDEAHALALAHHPGLAAATYGARAAEEVVTETRAGLLPQVSLVGSAVDAGSADTRILAGGLNNPTIMDRTAGGVLGSELLTDFGHTTNLTASSRFAARAAGENVAATHDQVLLGVDQAYYGVLQAQAIRDVAEQTVDTRQLLLDRIKILAANKLKSLLDVSFAQVAVDNAHLLLQTASSGVDNAYAILADALGARRVRRYRLVEPTSTTPFQGDSSVTSLVAEALRDRPDLAGLQDQVESAQRYARAERDARLPTIQLVGAAGGAFSHDSRLPSRYSAGGIEVSVPVFAGGLYKAREDEANFRARVASERLREAEDGVVRDVRIAWRDLLNAREQLRTSQRLVAASNESLELAEARYRVGTSSIVAVSQAQLQQTSAQISETNAHYTVLMQQSVLDYELGRLSSVDHASPAMLP